MAPRWFETRRCAALLTMRVHSARRLTRLLRPPVPSITAGTDPRRLRHAFHLLDHRTDPRPAAADGLAGGAVSGGVVAPPAAAFVPQPARRCRNRAGVRPRVSDRHRSRPAAGV